VIPRLACSYQARDCFIKYVATKVSKRIETNKLRGAFKETPKTLLLPVSLGVSSVSLIWVLNQQLASQHERNGKTLFKLHVLFIAHPHSSGNAQCHEAFHLLKQRFPSHMYSSISLEDMFDYDINIDNEILNIRAGNPELTNQERLEQVLLSLPSATSKADVESLLRLRLVVAFAKRNSCDSVIWGDSTTRLAERTLSEAAKGRGGSLPWLTADGLSPYGVKLSYPMRDLLKKELMAFASMTLPPLTDLIVVTKSSAQVSASSKDTTIDDLMSQYFESVEENFPSIVANVVRTSSRLVAPAVKPNEPSCCVCGLPIVMRFQEWGGNQESVVNNADMAEETVEADGSLCYGCARSALNPSGNSSTT